MEKALDLNMVNFVAVLLYFIVFVKGLVNDLVVYDTNTDLPFYLLTNILLIFLYCVYVTGGSRPQTWLLSSACIT